MAIGHFTTQINPVITNKHDRSRAVRYNRVWLYLKTYSTTYTTICCILGQFF